MKTIEMLTKIKENERAKATNWDVEVVKQNGDIIVLDNGHSKKQIGNCLPMTNLVLNDFDWIIIPNEISIDKAYELLKEHKPVTVVCKGNLVKLYDTTSLISVDELINGKIYEGLVNYTHYLVEDDLVDDDVDYIWEDEVDDDVDYIWEDELFGKK